jgi:hypothetical protein
MSHIVSSFEAACHLLSVLFSPVYLTRLFSLLSGPEGINNCLVFGFYQNALFYGRGYNIMYARSTFFLFGKR